jgi:8-oxo-dGTP diphosphatase
MSKAEPAPAVSVILVHHNRVLLVLRANHPARDLYAFPGGRVDPGETLEDAALRELKEETGLSGRNAQPFRVYDLIERDAAGNVTSHFLLTVFRAELAGNSTGDPVAADDAAEARFFTLEETSRLAMPESVRECIASIAGDLRGDL